MHELIAAVIRGFPIGCVYALVAVGLVLAFKTSGVFNLAFGAQAFTSAAVYYSLRVKHGWPIPPAVVVAVFVVAPLLGVALNWLLFRHLRRAAPVVGVVVSLGLLVALPSAVVLALGFGSSPQYGAQGIVPEGSTAYHPLAGFDITRDEIATIAVTLLAVLALTVLFRYARIGLQMRAVVESPRLTELTGLDADRVSSVAWMLSSTLAGVAGVLLSPLFPQVSADNYFLLIVSAIAAAAFAGLASLPRALVGGVLLGVTSQVLSTWLPKGSLLAQGLRPSFPFVALFVILVFSRSLRSGRTLGDPLADVDPPPPALAAEERSPALTRLTRAMALLAALVTLWWVLSVADDYWLLLATQAVIFSIIFLSITVITGMAGQISLAQATFAAIGGFCTAQLTDRLGMSVLLAALIGAVVAAAAGALLSLPALRLGGIHLALATLAFALFFENVLVKVDWIGGGTTPTRVPRPLLLGVDFKSNTAFFFLSVVLLAVVGVVVRLVRSGSTGTSLRAIAGSEVAAASIGINAARARVTAFALSAGIAGFGGGLLVVQQGQANYQASFTVFVGLLWVVIVVTLGARTIEGAIQAGIALRLTPEILDALHLDSTWQAIFFGLGALTFVRHPEGIVEHGKRTSMAMVQRLVDAHRP